MPISGNLPTSAGVEEPSNHGLLIGALVPSPGPKELKITANTNESKPAIFRPVSHLTLFDTGATLCKPWYRVHTEISSFHGSILHGNFVRILISCSRSLLRSR
ncbi:hypothetical protein FB451DRAFT_1165803 [Mycena latifolia]|nr:hypothetical protein FB451DRAFT_1165803 [Mycena latifolia]